MVQMIDLLAGGTLIAGVLGEPLTVDSLRQLQGTELLPHAIGSVEKVGMSQPVLPKRGLQRLLGDFLSDYLTKGHARNLLPGEMSNHPTPYPCWGKMGKRVKGEKVEEWKSRKGDAPEAG